MNRRIVGVCVIVGLGLAALGMADEEARRPPPRGSLVWFGTATAGSTKHAAGMVLAPPPPGGRPPEGVRPPRPPGELRIGKQVLLLKPGKVETGEARGRKVLRKLEAELVLPDETRAGTLALAIDPDPESGLGLVTGTATIADAAGKQTTYALSATLPPPHPPRDEAPEE